MIVLKKNKTILYMATSKKKKPKSCKKVQSVCKKPKKVKCFSRMNKNKQRYVICKCGSKVLRSVCVRRSKRKKKTKGGFIRSGTMQHFVTCGGKVVDA